MEPLETIVFDAASSLWVYPFIVLLSALDAFTIILPSETVVAGLSSTAVSLGAPNVFALGAAAALGAHLGDLGVFVVGRLLARLRWVTPGSRVDAAMRWTRRRLDAQGPLYIMTARYIPYGRLIVNATAGWTGFPFRRFVALSAVGCVIWATAYVGIGAGAGAWFGDQWWLAIVIAVVLALVVGWGVDRIIRSRDQEAS
tara:strand:+ start:369 stop:965 length:597 start_codon:yes stop_codon:yes gene_type:complete